MNSTWMNESLHQHLEKSITAPWLGAHSLCHPTSQTDSTTGRQLPLRALDNMEALCIQPDEVNGAMRDEVEQARSVEEALDACSPTSSTDEEDGDSEPQPPPVIRRKVSFADAFGLNLVSVKEFENVEARDFETSVPSDREEAISTDEFGMCCMFTVPPTPEVLEQKLQEQMVELESIELLPRTTTLRGTVRVVNLCYNKSVYARITLDHWRSHFDLPAEYVPGSSDRKTDRFTFQFTLVPPFEKEGTRVEFCLCYDTPLGNFWANNNKMNYVLFFYQKIKDYGPQLQEENSYKSKKSCLKLNRRESAEELIKEFINAATYTTESKVTKKAEVPKQTLVLRTGTQSSLRPEEPKHTVDSIKSRRRAASLARAQDHCPQRRQLVPQAYSHELPHSPESLQPISSVWSNSSSVFHESNKAQTNNNQQVLTYHQIPLLPLDWSNDKPQQNGAAGVNTMWAESAKITLSKSPEECVNDSVKVTNMWETFLNGTEETITKEAPVCDVWQAFLNGSDCEAQSDVLDSEWLQTATMVSPSNNEDPSTQCGASRQVHVGKDTPNLEARSSNACQPLPDTCETSLTNTALNTEDQEQAPAYVRSPRDDNRATQDAPQRSETNSVTETVQEFSLVGATPVSKGSVDSPSECHEHEIWEQEGERIIGGAGGIGGDEPFTMHRADLVTSSGESQTTDMTAMPESPNASAVDTISQGARLQEGLSYSRDGKVTGTAYNAMDDTLAFKETIRQGTQDGERFVFSTCSQGVEEGLTTNCAENEESKKEEIVRPREIKKCQGSQGDREGEQQKDMKFTSLEHERVKNIILSNIDFLNSNEICDHHYRQNQNDREFQSEWEKVSTCQNGGTDTNLEISPYKPKTECESKIIKILNEHPQPHKDITSQNLLAWHRENTAKVSEMNITQSLAPGKKLNDEEREESHPTQSRIKANVIGDKVLQTEQYCFEIMQERQRPCEEIPPSAVTKEKPFSTPPRTLETKKIFQSDTSQSHPTDEYNPEVGEISWTHSHSVITGHKEDGGSRVSSAEVVLKEKDTSAQLQPETLEGIWEDISQRDKDERLRIGKLKIEAMGEWMCNVENPRGESKHAPVKLKEQELSAEVENSPHVEYQKMSERTKNPIRPDSTVMLEQVEVREMFLERFGQELVRKVWQEVFDRQCKIQAPSTQAVGDPQGDHNRADCHLVRAVITCDKKCTEALDSVSFSMNRNESCFLDKTEEIPLAPNSNTSTDLDNDLNSTLDPDSCPLLPGSTYSPQKSQKSTNGKHRSVTLQEIDSQVHDCAVAYRERGNQTSQKQLWATNRKIQSTPLWRNILYALFHITRLLTCVLLVSGFFLIFFFYDLPTFFALYSFSFCCWIYKWRRYHLIQKRQDNGVESASLVVEKE